MRFQYRKKGGWSLADDGSSPTDNLLLAVLKFLFN